MFASLQIWTAKIKTRSVLPGSQRTVAEKKMKQQQPPHLKMTNYLLADATGSKPNGGTYPRERIAKPLPSFALYLMFALLLN